MTYLIPDKWMESILKEIKNESILSYVPFDYVPGKVTRRQKFAWWFKGKTHGTRTKVAQKIAPWLREDW